MVGGEALQQGVALGLLVAVFVDGDEVRLVGPVERLVAVAVVGLGDLGGLEAHLDLGGDVAVLGHRLEALLEQPEQLAPKLVVLGQPAPLVQGLEVVLIQAHRGADVADRPKRIVELGLGDVGHLAQGRDLELDVGGELEAALQAADRPGVVTDLGLQLGHRLQALEVVGELAHEPGVGGQCRGLVVQLAQPGVGDRLVQPAALVGRLGGEQQQLGLLDHVAPALRRLVVLEQRAGDLGVAQRDVLARVLEHLDCRVRVADLLGEDLGALPRDPKRVVVGLGQRLQLAERRDQRLPRLGVAVDPDEGLEGAAVIGAALEHLLEGGAGELRVVERGLGELGQAQQVVDLTDHRGLWRGGGLAHERAELLVARGGLVHRDHPVDDLEVVGQQVEQLRPDRRCSILVAQVALGDAGHPPQDLDPLLLARRLVELALEGRE